MSMIPQFLKCDRNFVPSKSKVFLFLPKKMPSGSNATLGYDIAWTNGLRSIFHIYLGEYYIQVFLFFPFCL